MSRPDIEAMTERLKAVIDGEKTPYRLWVHINQQQRDIRALLDYAAELEAELEVTDGLLADSPCDPNRLKYLEAIEAELAGYRSRDDRGFRRSLEKQ